MAFKINADKYSYTAVPEKIVESYSAELAKKLFSEEQSARMAAEEQLNRAISFEASARIESDAQFNSELEELTQAIDGVSGALLSEKSERQKQDTTILAEVLKKANSADVYMRESVDALLLDKAFKNHTHTAKDVGALSSSAKVSELENDKQYQTYDEVDNICSTWAVDTLGRVYTKDEIDSVLWQVNDDIGNLYNWVNEKADITGITTSQDTSYTFNFSTRNNCEVRLKAASAISIKFADNEYPEDYMSGLSFNSGETPTSFDYTDSGIINWVGTDCSTDSYTDDNGNERFISKFQPSPNTHYDIVFYFNGTQFIGLVNGFVPASGNVVSE